MEDAVALKFIAVALAMMGGAFGGGYGLSVVFSSWLNAIARNPSADKKLFLPGIMGFAGTELVLLLGFVTAALLIFAT
jgi:F0F1-type ATP synthase membrane subunit c/vacuolar-type H+-ATPase subunit K